MNVMMVVCARKVCMGSGWLVEVKEGCGQVRIVLCIGMDAV